MLWNGMRVETAYRIVYVNEAELDGTHGLVIAKIYTGGYISLLGCTGIV